jgi:hypothetical protein
MSRRKNDVKLNMILIIIIITYDFVTKLFNNKKYNTVLMIIDHLSKMHHYIFCTIDENEIAIEKMIKFFI